MSAPNSSSNSETPKKEPKVIVLSMKDGKTFRYDFATNVMTNIRDPNAGGVAVAKQPQTTALLSSPPSISSPPIPGTASNNGAAKYQNVIVQAVKKPVQQQTTNNILIRAQSPTSSSKKVIQSPQHQLSPIIDIAQPTFHKISTDIILKTQNPQPGNTVLLNPLAKNTTTVVALPQTVSKKFIITSQQQTISSSSAQPPKIIQITRNQTPPSAQITRKVVHSVSRPILPKPEAPKLVQSQPVIISQSIIQPRPALAPSSTATPQQIKPNVIAIPVATTSTLNPTYSKGNLQQQKWQSSSQPPALSPIRSNQVICVQSSQSQSKMDNVKILMEIEEMGSSEDTEEECEEVDESEKNHVQEPTPSSVVVVVEKENTEDETENAEKNDTTEEEHQLLLNVKRIIEGEEGLKDLSEKKLSQSNIGDKEVNTTLENNDSAVKKSESLTKTITTSTATASVQNSDSLLLCDEQISSATPEESPESVSDKLKETTTPTHTNESNVAIKTVNDVKKNLKLDLIASEAHNINSVNNNKKKIEMDDNESIASDEQSNESSPVDQKDEIKLDSQEMQTNVETGGNVEVKKPKRSRKPKNPTIITSLGLPYKPPQPSNRRKKVEKKIELELDFHDPIYKIMWDDGVGGLNNCNKLFGFNEFGLVEVLDSKDAPRSNGSNEIPFTSNDENSSIKCLRKISDPKDQYTCEVCSKLGTIRDFFSPECCSEACFAITKRRPAEMFNASNSTKDDDSGFNTPVDAKKIIHDGELITIQQLYQRIFDENLPDENRVSPKRKKRSVIVPDHLFSWDSYLTPKSVPVPESSFNVNISLLKEINQFKVGMKLEAIDPKNPHMFCVCTVEEKLGCRMKLHFDGYPPIYDFWVNIDSVNIFPPGFCEASGRKLCVPPRYSNKKFDWNEYFSETCSVGALKSLFPRLNSTKNKCPLQLGMKLEAKRDDYWYAATIIDNIDNRVLVRFDGKYENHGCLWYDIYSPYLKPCNGYKELDDPSLFLPPIGSIETFDWDEYLSENDENKAPEDFLRNKRRKPNTFESGMKLEVVDPACRQLIRPATVLCHENYKVQVIFDGFDISYAFWLDDNSEDMFPINYCKETDHPIEHPAGWNKKIEMGLCTIAGCRGIGNGIYPDRYFHDNPKECPYKIENWKRLIENNENSRLDYKYSSKRAKYTQRQDSSENSRTILVQTKKGKVEKIAKSPVETSLDDTSNDATNVIKASSKRGRKRKIALEPNVEEQIEEQNIKTESDENRLKKIRIMQPFLEDYGPQINYSFRLWTNNSKVLDKAMITDHDITKNPMHWNLEEVCTFIIKFCDEETTAKFYAQKIDGEAFLCLSQKDLIDLMKIKVGPAIKIYNRILLLRQEVMTKFAEF